MVRFGYVTGALTSLAPFVYVDLRNPSRAELELQGVPAQIDTGADRTVVPLDVINQLHLPQLDLVQVGGLANTTHEIPTYLVSLQIRNLSPIVIEVVAFAQERWILLGRDVLNHFRLLLDGPALSLEITQVPPPAASAAPLGSAPE